MKDQPLLTFAFACAVFVLALSTEIRAELVYKIPRDFGWRRSLPLIMKILSDDQRQKFEMLRGTPLRVNKK